MDSLSPKQLSSAACLVTECSAGTVQVGLFLLPLLGRLRLMMFSALFSILITCLMLFLDISTIALMFPFNWGKIVSSTDRSTHYTQFTRMFIVSFQFLVCLLRSYRIDVDAAEHVFIFVRWITTADIVHINIAHGFIC